MTIGIEYIRANITVEIEEIGTQLYYVYNYQGIHFRVFQTILDLSKFFADMSCTWIFECLTEEELEDYFDQLA